MAGGAAGTISFFLAHSKNTGIGLDPDPVEGTIAQSLGSPSKATKGNICASHNKMY
jgi:hypothetical protein